MGAQGYCLVGADVLGGFFAIDGGRFGAPGRIFFLDPREARWVNLNLGHSDWIAWAIAGDVAGFYGNLRWRGWEGELAAVSLGQGIACYPFLCTKEGADIGATSRKAVPLRELWTFNQSLHRQLFGVPF